MAHSSLRVNDPLLRNDANDMPTGEESSTSCKATVWRGIAIIIILISIAQWIGIALLIGHINKSNDDYQPGPYRPSGPHLECVSQRPPLSAITKSFVTIPITEITVIQHVRLIDGDGSPPIDNQRVHSPLR
jgi:hypothetical protein